MEKVVAGRLFRGRGSMNFGSVTCYGMATQAWAMAPGVLGASFIAAIVAYLVLRGSLKAKEPSVG